MGAHILVKAAPSFSPDDPMVFDTGFPVHVENENQLVGKQVPPTFFQVHVTDATKEEVWAYRDTWQREIDFEFTAHDFVNDIHALRVFVKSEFVSLSGLNSLTRKQVENYLNRWNINVSGVSQNSVSFNAAIIDVLESEGFWGINPVGAIFTENNYVPSTGIHSIGIDFSVTSWTNQQVIKAVEKRGGIVTGGSAGQGTFDISRSAVFDVFKADVKDKIDGVFAVRKFRIPAQYVQMALDNGGTLEVTKQQIATYIRNRLND